MAVNVLIQIYLLHDFCIVVSNIKNKLYNNLRVKTSPLPVKNSECAADNNCVKSTTVNYTLVAKYKGLLHNRKVTLHLLLVFHGKTLKHVILKRNF